MLVREDLLPLSLPLALLQEKVDELASLVVQGAPVVREVQEVQEVPVEREQRQRLGRRRPEWLVQEVLREQVEEEGASGQVEARAHEEEPERQRLLVFLSVQLHQHYRLR